jgi:hypothetical protein
MAVRMSQVKSVCSANEVSLVLASRKPQLETLSPAELKRSARRARALFDKWQGLARGQARARSQKEGFGEERARTQLKVDIFQEALQSFEQRLAKLEKASTGKTSTGKAAPGKSSAAKPKKARAAGHRSARADVRSKLAEKRIKLNEGRGQQPPKAANPPTDTPQATVLTTETAPVEGDADQQAPRPKRKPPVAPRPKKPMLTGIQKKLAADLGKQQSAVAAAKHSRVVQSGLTSRTRGHVSARGRRAQGRRDSKN